MAKAINDHLSSDFHWIINKYLEDNNIKVIKQDIDSWLLKVDETWLSFVWFYEIKRSFDISTWKPYFADANNYYALSKLSNLLWIDFFVLFYEKDKLRDHWVKIFKVNWLDWKNMFECLWITKMNNLRSELLKLSNLDLNGVREVALQWTSNNIYAVFNYFSNYNHLFYTENENSRWMVLSDRDTFEPKVIYKEIKNTERKESLLYDTAFIKIAKQLNLPIFKFTYSENNNKILSFNDLNSWEIIDDMVLNDFLKKYTSYIK